MSLKQEGFNPHLATGAYSSLYCSMATSLSGILDCLSSGNPVLMAPSMQGETCIDQITGDTCTYNQTN